MPLDWPWAPLHYNDYTKATLFAPTLFVQILSHVLLLELSVRPACLQLELCMTHWPLPSAALLKAANARGLWLLPQA